MHTLIEKTHSKFTQIRDFDKLLVVLAHFSVDSAFEVRNIAKEAFVLLLSSVLNH
jgi:hypothetical protein